MNVRPPVRQLRPSGGFTLIELLIVIAIIAILASVALPNLFAAKQASAESSAIGGLRTLNAAEYSYKARNGIFATIPQLYAQKMIDSVMASATAAATNKSGYFYTLTLATGGNQYWIVAAPVGSQGTKQFYTDETGAIFGDSVLTDSATSDVSGSLSTLGSNWSAIGN